MAEFRTTVIKTNRLEVTGPDDEGDYELCITEAGQYKGTDTYLYLNREQADALIMALQSPVPSAPTGQND